MNGAGPTIGAGRLSRRLVVERNTPSTDEVGQPVEVWAEVTRVWATDPKALNPSAVVVTADREAVRNRLTYVVRSEAGALIRRADRIVDGALTLSVVDVVPKDRGFSILTVEGVD